MKDTVGRNKLCPCQSGLKYKKCYLDKSDDCSIYSSEKIKQRVAEHKEKEKEVIDFLTNSIAEASKVFSSGQKNLHRAQLLMAFTLADILSQYWMLYLEKTQRQSDYFQEWLSEFCLSEVNQVYNQEYYLRKLDSEKLYKLRNSITHFFGLPREFKVVVFPEEHDPRKIKRFVDIFKKDLNMEIYPVQSQKIYTMIINGGNLMIERMREQIARDPDVYFNGISRIYSDVEDRGIKTVSVDEESNIYSTAQNSA